MEKLKFLRELIAVLCGLVALFQMVYSNDLATRERRATSAQICALASKVDRQAEAFEVAFQTKGEPK